VAKHIFYNASVVVNGVDLSDHVESVSVEVTTEDQAADAMGDTQRYDMPGLLKFSDPQMTFYQDFAAAKVYATFYALWAARSTFNVVVKNDAGANSATNPAWTLPVFVGKAPIFSGKHGERHMAPVTLKLAGTYTVATS